MKRAQKFQSPAEFFFLLSLSIVMGWKRNFAYLDTLTCNWSAMISWSVWFFKSNFQFMYLIIAAVKNVSFLARVLFLSFITGCRSGRGFFRPPLGFSFHTSFEEWEMSIFRMVIGISCDHRGSSDPCPLFMDDSEW